jgi:hypothetical protein
MKRHIPGKILHRREDAAGYEITFTFGEPNLKT